MRRCRTPWIVTGPQRFGPVTSSARRKAVITRRAVRAAISTVTDAEFGQYMGRPRRIRSQSFCRKPRIKTRRYCTSSACAGPTLRPTNGGGVRTLPA